MKQITPFHTKAQITKLKIAPKFIVMKIIVTSITGCMLGYFGL